MLPIWNFGDLVDTVVKPRQLILPNPDLLACPFCGSNDLATTFLGGQYVEGSAVRCSDCGARGPSALSQSMHGGSADHREKARAKWNQRVEKPYG
jgi:Lar family restriction alleviation protein